MTEPNAGELGRRIRADDPDAFGLLFERYGPRVHGYPLRRTGDPATADDLTAVVFLEAWRPRAEVVLRPASARPWLDGLPGHALGRWHRTRRRHEAALARLAVLP